MFAEIYNHNCFAYKLVNTNPKGLILSAFTLRIVINQE